MESHDFEDFGLPGDCALRGLPAAALRNQVGSP